MHRCSSGNTVLVFVIALVIGVLATLFALHKALPSLLVTEVRSPLGFSATVERLETNAKAIGWKVPKKWKANFQNNFKKIVGKDIGPMRLLKLCEPKIAADLLDKDENKYLSILMPCTFAVYEKADGSVWVAMMNLRILAHAIGGDVVPAMEKAWPDMQKMVNFD